MQEHIESSNEISLFELYKIIKRHIILILFITFLSGCMAGIYAYFIADERYQSDAYIMVQVQREGTQSGDNFDLINAQRLLQTTAELFKMPVVLERVVEDLKGEITLGELNQGLSVSSSNTSYFIHVTFISKDPDLSKKAVDSIIHQAILFANQEIPVLKDNIIRTSYAQVGSYASPNRPLYIAIGLLLGGILGVGFVLTKELMISTIQNKEQLEDFLNIQVLGVIPEYEIKERKQ